MGTPNSITLALRNIGGTSGSGFPAINPSNAWRIAAPFRIYDYQSMGLQHPLEDRAGQYAAFHWADSNMDHEVKIAWVGDDAPYRVSIIDAPAGSSIGGVQTQTFNRVPVAGTDLFEHQLPENFAVFKRVKESFSQGQTYTVRVLVESQSETIICRFTFTDDDTKSVWFSGTGNDANAGTFASPKQTFGHGFNLAGGSEKIYRYKAGTYVVNNGTPNNNANFVNRCKSHIGAEAGVLFNFDTGSFSAGGDDLSFYNLETTGGVPTMRGGNVRQFDFDGVTRRSIWHNVAFETNVIGNAGDDNPCAVFLGNVDGGNTGLVYHENIVFSDCRLKAGSKTQMYTPFRVVGFVAINCHAPEMNTTLHNGSRPFHLKDGYRDVTVQFFSASGKTDGGLFWASSQAPQFCSNISISLGLLDYAASNTAYNAMRLNGQQSGSDPNATDLYLKRTSFIARQSAASNSSIVAETNGSGLPLAKISACAWQSSGSTFVIGAGSEFVGTASEKVSDVLSLPNDKKGLIGHKIYSTLVT